MKPKLYIHDTDYTKYVMELKPSLNDIDADGSGRNIVDGTMYRSRIATKLKWTVSFLRLDEATMQSLLYDLYWDDNYITVTVLDARTNEEITVEAYCSTVTQGTQRYIGGETVYDGATFNLTER